MKQLTCRHSWLPLFFTAFLCAQTARPEVLLQYFETEWDEIYRRLPEMAEVGYEGLWLPPPSKSPHAGGQFAGGGNVGYSHFDKFDLGDIPQRGSRATRYGTRGSLRNLTDNAHQAGIKNYPDIVMNHTGNGPDYRTYPGTKPNDFHGWFDGGQPGGFKRAPRMSNYGDVNNGYGRTFQEELVSLIDFQTVYCQFAEFFRATFFFPPARASGSLSLWLHHERKHDGLLEPLDHLAGQRDGFRWRATGCSQACRSRFLRNAWRPGWLPA